MHGNAVVAGDHREFADRHDGSDLVVRPHHRDQCGLVGMEGEFGAQGVRMHPTFGVDRQPGDAGALVLGQPLDRIQHRMVFHRAGDDPRARWIGVPTSCENPFHREVVTLGAA